LDRAKQILRNLEENGLDATGKPSRVPEVETEKPKAKTKKGKKKKTVFEQPQFTFCGCWKMGKKSEEGGRLIVVGCLRRQQEIFCFLL